MGPSVLNCDALSSVNGRTCATHANGSLAPFVGRHSPIPVPCVKANGVVGYCPSPIRFASIAAAAAAPAVSPSDFASLGEIAPSSDSYCVWTLARIASLIEASVSGATSGITCINTWCAAVATAASIDAPGDAAATSRYGSYPPTIEFTASYTAPCTIAMWITPTVGG